MHTHTESAAARTLPPRPLAKALHTVTVLERVARFLIERHGHDADAAIPEALNLLGYGGADDPHALALAAYRKIKGGAS